MQKLYYKWGGKMYVARTVYFPVQEEMETWVIVADYDLWEAISKDYDTEDPDAIALDGEIFFYCEGGFIASDPTDDEIINYLLEHGC